MYQYSRAIYRSIKDLIDPYATRDEQAGYRREVLVECERTMTRLAEDPHYFARPDRALFADIRRHFPITAQAQVAWAVREGVGAATSFIEQQVEAGLLDGGIARCHATTRKGSARRSPAATTARRTSISSTRRPSPHSPGGDPQCRASDVRLWMRASLTFARSGSALADPDLAQCRLSLDVA
jgi:hypothetical protein